MWSINCRAGSRHMYFVLFFYPRYGTTEKQRRSLARDLRNRGTTQTGLDLNEN